MDTDYANKNDHHVIRYNRHIVESGVKHQYNWRTQVAQLDYLTTHKSLSPIRRGFAPGFVNYKKGALDSQPQVILQVACPWSVVLSGYSGLFHHRNRSPWYSWNIAESGVKHNKNQSIKTNKTDHHVIPYNWHIVESC